MSVIIVIIYYMFVGGLLHTAVITGNTSDLDQRTFAALSMPSWLTPL